MHHLMYHPTLPRLLFHPLNGVRRRARTRHDTVADQIAGDTDITSIVLETQMMNARDGVLVCGSDGEIEPGKSMKKKLCVMILLRS